MRSDTSGLESGISSGRKSLSGFQKQADKAGRVQLSADDSQLQGGVSRARKTVSNFASQIKGVFSGVRSDAAKGADFKVRTDERGFSGISSRIKGIRSEAQSGATMKLGADDSGLRGAGSRIDDVRANASRGATMKVSADDSQVKGLGDSIKSVGESAAGVAGGIALEDVGSGMAGNFREAGQAVGGFQGRLGATKGDAQALSDVGKNVFKGAWGGSLEEVNQAVTTVAQGLGTMGDAGKTQKLTEQAMTLSDAFGMDVTESVEAARLMSQNFGISSERAFDLLAAGARDGANTSGDLTDSLREYSPMFDRLGISGSQAMGMFTEGTKQGIWNTDRLGDAVKEFSVRAVDGSDTTKEGFKMAGLNARQMSDDIAAGGPKAQAAFQKTVSAIQGIENPQKRAQAGVALFGTLYEDIGEKGLTAMSKGSEGMGKVDGAAKKTGDSLYNNFTTKMQGAMRSAQVFASDSGLGMAGGVLSGITENAGFAGMAVMGLGPTVMRAAPMVASGFTLMLGPVGLAIAAVTAVAAGAFLIYKNWDKIGPWFAARWQQVKNAAGIAWNGIKSGATSAWNGLKTAFSGVGQWVSSKFVALKTGALGALSGLKQGVVGVATGVKNAVVSGFTMAKNRAIAVVGGLRSGVVAGWNFIRAQTMRVWGGIRSLFGAVWGFLGQKARAGVNLVRNVVASGWNFVRAQTSRVWGGIRAFFGATWSFLSSKARAGANLVRNGVSAGWNFVRARTMQVWNGIKSFFGTVWGFLSSKARSGAGGVRSAVTAGWNAVRSVTSSVWNGIRSFFASSWQFLSSKARAGAGLVKSAVTTGWNAVKSATSSVWNGIKSFLGSAWRSFVSTARSGANAIRSGVSAAWNAVKSGTTTVYNGIKSFMSGLWTGLKNFVVKAADSLRSGVGSAWNRLKDWTSSAYNAIKDKMSSTVRSAADSVESRVSKLWNSMKSTWSSIKDGTKAAFSAIGNFMIDPISAARDALKSIWNSILDGVAKVLDAVKLKGLAGDVRGAKWGDGATSGASGAKSGPVAMARGGVISQSPVGGMADGSSPRAVYGEVGKREYYIVPERPDNVPLLQGAAKDMGYRLVPQGAAERDRARRGTSQAPYRTPPANNSLFPRGATGGGEGPGATMHTYIPEVDKIQKKIAGQFGTYTNTYSNHPPGPFRQPHFRERSVDFWGGFRGDPVGVERGNAVAGAAIKEFGTALNWLIWNGRMLDGSGWGPDTSGYYHGDHVHATAFADHPSHVGGGATGPTGTDSGGGGGGGISIPNPLQLLFDRLWKPIQSKVDGFDKEMQSGMVLRAATGKTAKNALGGVHDWIDEKIPDTLFGGGGGGSGGGPSGGSGDENRKIGKKMLKAAGLGAQWNSLNSLWTKESQWDVHADNPTSDAYGIPQALPGSKMASSGPDWKDNASTQIDWGLGYIKERYGDPNAAWGHSQSMGWYEKGGRIPGRPGQHKPILAEAGEVVLPQGVSSSFLRFADAIDRTAGAAREHRVNGAGAVFGAAGALTAPRRSTVPRGLPPELAAVLAKEAAATNSGNSGRALGASDMQALTRAIREMSASPGPGSSAGGPMRLHPEDLADLAVAVSHITVSPLMGDRIRNELAESIHERRRLIEGKAAR